MERRKKDPERHSSLHDPKLPVIHGETCGNRSENHICPAPVPSQESDLPRHEL